jgi:hypothetical protein
VRTHERCVPVCRDRAARSPQLAEKLDSFEGAQLQLCRKNGRISPALAAEGWFISQAGPGLDFETRDRAPAPALALGWEKTASTNAVSLRSAATKDLRLLSRAKLPECQ